MLTEYSSAIEEVLLPVVEQKHHSMLWCIARCCIVLQQLQDRDNTNAVICSAKTSRYAVIVGVYQDSALAARFAFGIRPPFGFLVVCTSYIYDYVCSFKIDADAAHGRCASRGGEGQVRNIIVEYVCLCCFFRGVPARSFVLRDDCLHAFQQPVVDFNISLAIIRVVGGCEILQVVPCFRQVDTFRCRSRGDRDADL